MGELRGGERFQNEQVGDAQTAGGCQQIVDYKKIAEGHGGDGGGTGGSVCQSKGWVGMGDGLYLDQEYQRRGSQ